MTRREPLRVGIGGPVGSGKTALVDSLCKAMRERFNLVAITNDIYTREDAEFLTRSGALPPERIRGVETGGCPHTAIREDASINLAAVAEMSALFPALDLIFIESGGDNLAATFSPELADITIYVIDVAAGDKIPRKGGPGITRSDLLVINKIDLAPHVGASLEVMVRAGSASQFSTIQPVAASSASIAGARWVRIGAKAAACCAESERSSARISAIRSRAAAPRSRISLRPTRSLAWMPLVPS